MRSRLEDGSDIDALRLSGIIGGGVGRRKSRGQLGPEAPINMIGDKRLISIFDMTKVRPKNIDGKDRKWMRMSSTVEISAPREQFGHVLAYFGGRLPK